MREGVILQCTECKRRNYTATRARKRKTAVIAMKVLAAGRGLSRLSLDELLHYALNLPIATAIVVVTK